MEIDLSVVIPALDAAATIETQLDAVLAQEVDCHWELIVADNGSVDETRRIVERYAANDARVRLVDASDVRGPAHGRNCGIRAARGRAIACCDADDLVATGWLQAMASALRDHEYVAGRLEVLRLNAPDTAGSRGSALAAGAGDFFGIVRFANSGNLGVQRSTFDLVGGFAEDFRVGEDVELALRMLRAGVKVHYCDDATVHVRYRSSAADLWRQARSYGRAQPALVERARADGLAVPPQTEWRRWVWLVRKLPLLASAHGGRSRWISTAGGCVGRIEGRRARRHAAGSGVQAFVGN